jgi:hypothetical protein
MDSKFSRENGHFDLKRVLLIVALVQLVLSTAMFIYWRVYKDEFFPYPINEDGSVTCAGESLLVGYGERIPPPWTFTGVGSDTLRLNGMPFEPLRSSDDAVELMPHQRDRIRTIRAILEEAELAYKASPNKREGMQAFAAVLDPYLGGVLLSYQLDMEQESLVADFGNDIPAVTVNFLHDPHWVEPEGLIRNRHYGAIREFIVWMEENRDGVFCFGTAHLELSSLAEDRRAFLFVLNILETMPRHPNRELTPDDVRHVMADDALFYRFESLINDYLLREAR